MLGSRELDDIVIYCVFGPMVTEKTPVYCVPGERVIIYQCHMVPLTLVMCA